MTGKLSTAMTTLLLLVLEAIADRSVREAENPKAVRRIVRLRRPISATGLFKKMVKKINPMNERREHRKKL